MNGRARKRLRAQASLLRAGPPEFAASGQDIDEVLDDDLDLAAIGLSMLSEIEQAEAERDEAGAISISGDCWKVVASHAPRLREVLGRFCTVPAPPACPACGRRTP